MKTIWLLVLVMTAAVSWAQTCHEFPVDFVTNAQGPWSLDYGNAVPTASLMTDAGGTCWNANGARPSYGEYAPEFRLVGNTDSKAYLVFTCPADGIYGIKFTIATRMQTVFDAGVETAITVYTNRTSAPIWSASANWYAAGTITTDLGAVSRLQRMKLAAEDAIIIQMGIENLNNYNEGVFTIIPSGSSASACIVMGVDDVPWWTDTDGNPHTDANGNAWGVYQPVNDVADWGGYIPMAWDGGAWMGPDPLYGHPSYLSPTQRILTSGYQASGNRISALTFTPAVAGFYSWAGTVSCQDWGGNAQSCRLDFGVFSSANAYRALKSVAVAHNGTVNLATLAELQTVSLATGDRLVVAVTPLQMYSAMVVYLRPGGSADPARIEKVDLGDLRNVRNVKEFGAVGDGVADDTAALQAAIGNGPGVIYFPSGTYKVSAELKVWGAYGQAKVQGDYSGVRPTILLAAGTPGYNDPATPAYVLRFYQEGPPNGGLARGDTYGSQLDGINFTLQSGNAGAIAIGHTGAQNSSIRNCDITMAGNLLGINGFPGDSVGENIKVTGGQVGVKHNEWWWPLTLKGCTFVGQTIAGVDVYENSVVFEGCVFDGCAAGIRVPYDTGYPAARLYLENCIFKNLTGGSAIIGTQGTRFDWLMAMKNVYFQNCTNIAYWSDGSSPAIAGQASGWCRADYVTHGNRWEEGVQKGGDGANYREVTASVAAPTFTATSYVDAIPGKAACVNVKDYGAAGDGIADDTAAIRNAIANATVPIWFPMGTYRVHDTITLNANTKLIGEHCGLTEIRLVPAYGDTSFNDSANPKPLMDTVNDPNGTAVLAHLYFGSYVDDPATAGTIEFNGLIGIRWRVGRASILDDIFSLNWSGGGETQTGYCALQITGGGGGHVRQFWAPWANDAGPGVLVIDGTVEPLTLYGISFEHNLTKPMVFITDAKNVTVRQLQAEHNLSIVDAYNSHNLVFNDVLFNVDSGQLPVGMHFTDCSDVEIDTYYRFVVTPYSYTDAVHWVQNGVETTVPSMGLAAYRRFYLFYDGFESNTFTAGGWTSSGCDLQTTYKSVGSYAARFNFSDSLTKALGTANYQTIQVSYARYTRNCTSACHFIAEWYNGSTWTTLENQAGNSAWAVKTFALPAGAANNPNFRLRFRTSGNGSSNYAYLDEVKINGDAIAQP